MTLFLSDFLTPLSVETHTHWHQTRYKPQKSCPAVIVLDDVLGADSLDLPKKIKHACPEVRLIILSSRHQLKERLVLLENGADLCLLKPFAPEELRVYVNKFLAQSSQAITRTAARIDCAPFALFAPNKQLRYRELNLALSPLIFDLFWLLLCHSNQTLSRQHIAEALWGSESSQRQLRTVDQYVRQLRKLLTQHASHQLVLETQHRKGYILHAPGKVSISEGV